LNVVFAEGAAPSEFQNCGFVGCSGTIYGPTITACAFVERTRLELTGDISMTGIFLYSSSVEQRQNVGLGLSSEPTFSGSPPGMWPS